MEKMIEDFEIIKAKKESVKAVLKMVHFCLSNITLQDFNKALENDLNKFIKPESSQYEILGHFVLDLSFKEMNKRL